MSVLVSQPQPSHTDVRQQHSYPASMPSGQFCQSLANTVQRRQHADPSSMPTNQLQRSSANKMQPQSTNQTTTENIELYPASSNPMIQPQYSLWQYTTGCVTPQYSRQVQSLCYVLCNRRLHKKLRINICMKTCFDVDIFFKYLQLR